MKKYVIEILHVIKNVQMNKNVIIMHLNDLI